jgi:hypothetical protein
MTEKTLTMRLALRVEGDWWVAYIAERATMTGALEIGRIAMGIVAKHPALKASFMALMQASVTTALEDVLGVKPSSFTVEVAPEHERSGRA